METKKEHLANSYLKSLVGSRIFLMKIPPIHLLRHFVGVDKNIYDIISWKVWNLFIFVIVKLKANDIVVRVITVYDSSYEDKKEFMYKDTP
jgi:hypothetical protein